MEKSAFEIVDGISEEIKKVSYIFDRVYALSTAIKNTMDDTYSVLNKDLYLKECWDVFYNLNDCIGDIGTEYSDFVEDIHCRLALLNNELNKHHEYKDLKIEI